MPFSQYLASSLLNWHRGTSMPPPPPAIYIGLHGGDPGASGLLNDVTVGIAENRGAILASDWGASARMESGETISYVISNVATVSLAESAVGTALVSHFSCWDSLKGGNFLGYGVIADSLTIVVGDPVCFLPGALKIRVLTPKGTAEELPPSPPSPSSSPLIAISPLPEHLISFYGGPYVFGWSFTTNVNYRVTGVGIYASTVTEHKVGIWSVVSSDYGPEWTLVWQGLVQPANGVLAGNFLWYPIENGPVLEYSVQYVVGATWDEPAPMQLGQEELTVLADEVVLPQGGGAYYTFSGDVPQLNVDLSLEPEYWPMNSSLLLARGIFTVNLSVTED